MRALLIGANGQLGHDLRDVWAGDLLPYTHDQLDVCDRVHAHEIVARDRPDIVLNCAAYHRVDECETQVEKSFAVNSIGAKNIADAAHEAQCAVMFISTDYVFDGEKASPYVESDSARPLSVYGTSKLAGEHLVRQANPRHYVVRSSSLFGVAGASGKGGNFVETMLNKARSGEPLRVVDDQVSAPTFTRDLAEQLQKLAQTERYGLYHLTNAGRTSWHDFAAKIFELAGLDANLSRTSAKELASPARRPAFSVMENRELQKAGIQPARSWEAALEDYLAQKGYIGASAQPARR